MADDRTGNVPRHAPKSPGHQNMATGLQRSEADPRFLASPSQVMTITA